MSTLDFPRLGRLGAIALAVVAVLWAALALGRQASRPGAAPPAVSSASLSTELDRCRTLGVAAQDDGGCMKAWRASRERFLGLAPEARP